MASALLGKVSGIRPLGTIAVGTTCLGTILGVLAIQGIVVLEWCILYSSTAPRYYYTTPRACLTYAGDSLADYTGVAHIAGLVRLR